MKIFNFIMLIGIFLGCASSVYACGVPSPGGGPPQCLLPPELGGTSESTPIQMNFALSSYNSTLVFDGDIDVDIATSALTVTTAWALNSTWTASASLGLILSGDLDPEGSPRHDITNGWVASFGMEKPMMAGAGSTPSVDMTIVAGISSLITEHSKTDDSNRYTAFDINFGFRASWVVNETIFPYTAIRFFGGPVYWELGGDDEIGTDKYHYQLAAGAAMQLNSIALFAEISPVGARSLNLGLSIQF